MKKSMCMAKETRNVDLPGLKNQPDSQHLYFRQGLPWPASDRDLVLKMDFFVLKPAGEVRIIGKKIDKAIASGSVIHMPVGEMEWALKPAEGGTEAAYQCLASPGGSIPTSVLNFMLKQIGEETIINLRKLAKQPHYQAGTIVTPTPWQSNN